MSRVLLADDEEAFRDILSAVINKKGKHEIRMFSDGQKLLSAFLSDSSWPDMIVTDYEMPNMTGLAAIREIRKIRTDIPVILVSGSSDIDEESLPKQNIHLLRKPFPNAELLRIINYMSASHLRERNK